MALRVLIRCGRWSLDPVPIMNLTLVCTVCSFSVASIVLYFKLIRFACGVGNAFGQLRDTVTCWVRTSPVAFQACLEGNRVFCLPAIERSMRIEASTSEGGLASHHSLNWPYASPSAVIDSMQWFP